MSDLFWFCVLVVIAAVTANVLGALFVGLVLLGLLIGVVFAPSFTAGFIGGYRDAAKRDRRDSNPEDA